MNRYFLTLIFLWLKVFLFSGQRTSSENRFVISFEAGDYRTIKEALDDPDLPEGATLFLADRIYTEQDIIINKDVAIIGKSPEKTIVQAALEPETATGRVFEISEGSHVTLENMTIQYGNVTICPKTGGGIYSAGNLTINNCCIKENRSASGGGITLKRGSIIIDNCAIIDNVAHGISDDGLVRGSGGAIKGGEGTLIISNTLIQGNSANRHGGGVKSGCLVNMTMDNCHILENITKMNGGGVHVKGSASISRTTVEKNLSSLGGGVFNVGSLSIYSSKVFDNAVRNQWGCSGLLNGDEGEIPELKDCTIDELRGYDET